LIARVVVALLAVVALAGPASAQRAEAQEAFERGRKLMKDGDFKAACASFETSLRLDPANGTLYHLGLCHDKLGKLASAWAELKQVAETDTNKGRAADATRRVAALEPRLTRFKLVVPEQVDGLVIERDGIDITALVGQAVPVDPRTYSFKATAPGKQPVTLEVALDREGEIIEVRLPAFPSDNVVTPAPTGYPTQLALRPVTLPDLRYEVTVANTAATSTSQFQKSPFEASVAARFAIQKFELGLRTSVTERREEIDPPHPNRWATIAGTVTYAITPMFAGRFEYVRFHPVGNVGNGSDLRIALERKQVLHPRFVFDGTGGFVFKQRTFDGGGSASELVLQANPGVQVIATPRLGFEAVMPIDLNLGGTLEDYTVGLGVAPGALFAATDQVDVFARVFVGLLPAANGSSASDLRVYTVGVNWRPRR